MDLGCVVCSAHTCVHMDGRALRAQVRVGLEGGETLGHGPWAGEPSGVETDDGTHHVEMFRKGILSLQEF